MKNEQLFFEKNKLLIELNFINLKLKFPLAIKTTIFFVFHIHIFDESMSMFECLG